MHGSNRAPVKRFRRHDNIPMALVGGESSPSEDFVDLSGSLKYRVNTSVSFWKIHGLSDHPMGIEHSCRCCPSMFIVYPSRS